MGNGFARTRRETVWLSHPIMGTMKGLPSSLLILFNSLSLSSLGDVSFILALRSSLYFERFGEKLWVPLKCPTGGRNSNPVQYSCLGNLMNRGNWWASVHGVAGVRHDLATKPPPPGVGHPTQVYEHVPVRLISSLSLFPPRSLLSSNPRSN